MIQANVVLTDDEGASTLITIHADEDVVFKIIRPKDNGTEDFELTWTELIAVRDLATFAENNI